MNLKILFISKTWQFTWVYWFDLFLMSRVLNDEHRTTFAGHRNKCNVKSARLSWNLHPFDRFTQSIVAFAHVSLICSSSLHWCMRKSHLFGHQTTGHGWACVPVRSHMLKLTHRRQCDVWWLLSPLSTTRSSVVVNVGISSRSRRLFGQARTRQKDVSLVIQFLYFSADFGWFVCSVCFIF